MKQPKQLKKEDHALPSADSKGHEGRSLPAADNGINFTIQKKENKTGLPDNLKSGVENLSGHSMDDVKVHYNSAQPSQLNAHAYAQGNQIHIAPGQEKHLAHEAWHVVQQKQGRVKPTKQLKSSVAINDDTGLEKEADMMGARAMYQLVSNHSLLNSNTNTHMAVTQRVIHKKLKDGWKAIANHQEAKAHELPDQAEDLTFFNDATGVSGKTLDSVKGISPYGKTAPLFDELIKLIDEDDVLEMSEFDIDWKQALIRHRNDPKALELLAAKKDKSRPPEDLPPVKPEFDHEDIGTFDISDKDQTAKRLKTQEALLSNDLGTRKDAVSEVRGRDEVYSLYQGAILRQFIAEERKAILALVHVAKGASAVFSLERGGSMIADLMEKIAGGEMAPNEKVRKPTLEDVNEYLKVNPVKEGEIEGKKEEIEKTMRKDPANQKQVQADMFKYFVKKYIEEQKEGEITIAVVETAVGGGSVNSMVSTISEICDELKDSKKKVTFKILVARETIKNTNYKGSGVLKIHDPINIRKNEGIKPMKALTTDNPHQVEMYISQTRYLIGEDVDYQLQYSGGNSDKPVIVYEGSGDDVTALSITPAAKGDSARKVIIDLVAGAYDDLMENIFGK